MATNAQRPAAEVIATAVVVWPAIRVVRRFRSVPWLRAVRPAGSML
jgi:hypothetical protein